MKKKLSKLVSHLLTVLIILQALLCFALLYRTAAKEDVAVFGYRFYYIVSPSMEPTIATGAEIVVKEIDTKSLEVGDIVTFASRDPAISGYPNTHRISQVTTDERGRLIYITKGDNNPTEDQYPVYPEDIYGKVVGVTPALKGLIMFYSFAATPMGFMVVVVMPLLLVFGAFFRSLIKELKSGMAAGSAEGVGMGHGVAAGSAEGVGMNHDMTAGNAATAKTMGAAEMQRFIALAVEKYIKEHPNRQLTGEEAKALATELAKNLGQ